LSIFEHDRLTEVGLQEKEVYTQTKYKLPNTILSFVFMNTIYIINSKRIAD